MFQLPLTIAAWSNGTGYWQIIWQIFQSYSPLFFKEWIKCTTCKGFPTHSLSHLPEGCQYPSAMDDGV
jgi:hypothetical protein